MKSGSILVSPNLIFNQETSVIESYVAPLAASAKGHRWGISRVFEKTRVALDFTSFIYFLECL